MNIPSDWKYDELNHVGTDYSDMAEVEAYDARHAGFRDVEKENDDILDALSIQKDHVVIELGTGTGAFAVQAASRCKKVYAVDVSRAMLAYAKNKADKLGLSNMVFCHGGFLSYSHEGEPADAVVSSLALHHLPDFWKAFALQRINSMLKTGGRFFLSDVVFSDDNSVESINKWIKNAEEFHGKELADEGRKHFSKEYSTFSWIMEGLLERAGFKIENKMNYENVMENYMCIKM